MRLLLFLFLFLFLFCFVFLFFFSWRPSNASYLLIEFYSTEETAHTASGGFLLCLNETEAASGRVHVSAVVRALIVYFWCACVRARVCVCACVCACALSACMCVRLMVSKMCACMCVLCCAYVYFFSFFPTYAGNTTIHRRGVLRRVSRWCDAPVTRDDAVACAGQCIWIIYLFVCARVLAFMKNATVKHCNNKAAFYGGTAAKLL